MDGWIDMDNKDLIDAYGMLATASENLKQKILEKAGEDADCAEQYPFDESFDDKNIAIQGWCNASIWRLKPQLRKLNLKRNLKK
tara:strand:- start:241 stop:492 length:252 start_codon:yes stop_codon:yes gene_type:complete